MEETLTEREKMVQLLIELYQNELDSKKVVAQEAMTMGNTAIKDVASDTNNIIAASAKTFNVNLQNNVIQDQVNTAIELRKAAIATFNRNHEYKVNYNLIAQVEIEAKLEANYVETETLKIDMEEQKKLGAEFDTASYQDKLRALEEQKRELHTQMDEVRAQAKKIVADRQSKFQEIYGKKVTAIATVSKPNIVQRFAAIIVNRIGGAKKFENQTLRPLANSALANIENDIDNADEAVLSATEVAKVKVELKSIGQAVGKGGQAVVRAALAAALAPIALTTGNGFSQTIETGQKQKEASLNKLKAAINESLKTLEEKSAAIETFNSEQERN